MLPLSGRQKLSSWSFISEIKIIQNKGGKSTNCWFSAADIIVSGAGGW